MGIRRVAGSDVTAARRLARSEPMAPRGARADETPRLSHIEKLKPGGDPRPAIGRLYTEGRTYPHGKPHDYTARERTPEYRTPTPSRDVANYDLGKNSPVDPAPNEYGPQFYDDKKFDRVDTKEAWCRGMAKEQHPFFDSGRSGDRYRK
jgi:hypothetical protein